MSAFRIVSKSNCSPPAYVIQETVTPSGNYIEWPELYASVNSAKIYLGKIMGKVKVQVCVPWSQEA